MEKNRDKELYKSVVKTHSYSVLVLREHYRFASMDRHTIKVRLSEAFDCDFDMGSNTEKLTDLNMDYPMLGFLILTAFSLRHKHELANSPSKVERRTNFCVNFFYSLLLKYETVAVNEEFVHCIDSFFRDHLPYRTFFKTIRAITIPHDQKIGPNSMLMARPPNVCIAHTYYGRCDNKNGGRGVCGGRHICVEKECSQPRGHSTPFCSENTASLSTGCIARVQSNIKHSMQTKKRGGKSRNGRKPRRNSGNGGTSTNSHDSRKSKEEISLEKQLNDLRNKKKGQR
jgi:hypothetical protein